MALLIQVTIVCPSRAQCDLKRFRELIQEGDSYLNNKEPDYQMAINAYSAAITVCKDEMPEIQKKFFILFERVNQL
ncbi:MAG: hypothetical protein WCJ95_20910 [Mariniphaga sp.]